MARDTAPTLTQFIVRDAPGDANGWSALSSNLDGGRMKRVALVQVRDQDAGVNDDHAGQSSRSRSRWSGS